MAKQGLISPEQYGRIASLYGDIGGAMPEAYADPNVGAGALITNAITGLVGLPKRAIDASAQDVQHLGEEGYSPKSVGPATDAALLITGAAGGIPAEVNTLRAGVRPYQNVSRELMGYRKSGPQKGFGETNYPHKQPVEVTFKNGYSFTDAVEGMNPDHAIERAYRNWPDAIHIRAITDPVGGR